MSKSSIWKKSQRRGGRLAPAAEIFAAAVQEDQKLNRCVYCLVPRHLSESDFWRLYFSKTLAILDSVKQHGTFPPPAPKAVAKKKKAKAAAAPPPEDDSYCAVQ